MINQLKYQIRNLLALRFFTALVSENLFFIFGCQRSGTTLLLSVLNAHPQITAVDETEFPSPYPFPSAQRLAINRLTNHYLCFKILEHSHKLDFLKRFYPHAKILWTIRNPHSTIASMISLTNSQGNWLDRCVMKEIERLTPFFYKELKQWNLCQLSKVELGAIYWLYKNQYPLILKSHGFDVLVFKYEEHLQNQKAIFKKITDFLEIEWSDDLLNFHQKNSSKILAGGTIMNRPINVKKAKNLKGLSNEDLKKIDVICKPLMSQYGYEEQCLN